MNDNAAVKKIENFVSKYVTFAEPMYTLPLALWTIATFLYETFDAFPYLVITSATKRSGKTRLAEILSFMCSRPRSFAALTASTVFRSIQSEKPTLFFDEAEELSSESAGTMRSVLNVGYRRGATVPRMEGTELVEFPTYCPKVFILIGSPFDTLKDRSIMVEMQRAEPRERFVYEAAKEEGAGIRSELAKLTEMHQKKIGELFADHRGLPFLQDRDEEIWTALFCICQMFCPSRLDELKVSAVDMAAMKTAQGKRYIQLAKAEGAARDDEYAQKLLMDLYGILGTTGRVVSTKDAVEQLWSIPVAPWRRFRGRGLTAFDLSNMLRRFDVRPVRVSVGTGRKNRVVLMGYRLEHVEKAVKGLKQ